MCLLFSLKWLSKWPLTFDLVTCNIKKVLYVDGSIFMQDLNDTPQSFFKLQIIEWLKYGKMSDFFFQNGYRYDLWPGYTKISGNIPVGIKYIYTRFELDSSIAPQNFSCWIMQFLLKWRPFPFNVLPKWPLTLLH